MKNLSEFIHWNWNKICVKLIIIKLILVCIELWDFIWIELNLIYNILVIGLGGFIGAILRYGVSGWAYRLLGSAFPYGTLVVNIFGSFLLGFFLTLVTTKIILPYQLKNFIAIGILGAFTTFSTFSYETVMLMQNNLVWATVLNISLNVLLAIFALWIGIVAARMV